MRCCCRHCGRDTKRASGCCWKCDAPWQVPLRSGLRWTWDLRREYEREDAIREEVYHEMMDRIGVT